MSKLNKISGVYQITNIENDLIYIGSSKDIYKRWNAHIKELNKGTHINMFLQKDWNEYGEECFEFEILEQCEEDKRYELEQDYLDEFLPFNRTENGYNINENSLRKNSDGLRIFKTKYRTFNEFYGFDKWMIKRKLKNMIKEGEFIPYGTLEKMSNDIDTKSKYIWKYIEGNCYFIISQDASPRFVDADLVNSSTRKELISYCESLDTYDMLRSMAFEGYMDEEDWM